MAGGKMLNNVTYYQIFYKIRETFNSNPDNEYDDFLHKTDQTLRNIGMYLIENYKGDYSYCTPNEDCTERCSYLNAWLNEKKSIYTSNGKCDFYNKLWQDHVEQLWNKLDGNADQGKKCKRDGDLSNKKFPKEKFSVFCNMNPSEVLSYTCPDKAYDNSCTTMLTVTYVVIGIILLYMYFSKSSNLGNKIKNIIKNKIGIGYSTDEENNDELLSSENDTMSSINRMYNINYNSSRN
ncbi:PIR Superfamily Protein [Plasmodium ovale wallikeri]|uniref:PIR protein n=2 Tax=Plasmodium ovale TaxID=36330 RepID=A0A1C3KM55_PLAOA|nr:PIR Superfamily Protein [Plasmodium ovale wallikeri]SBT75091.1 PIR protein [Plasmodium ovale]